MEEHQYEQGPTGAILRDLPSPYEAHPCGLLHLPRFLAKIRKHLARDSRVSKFNIGTELRMAFGNSLRKSLTENPEIFDRIKLLSPTVDAVKNMTIEVSVSGPNNQDDSPFSSFINLFLF